MGFSGIPKVAKVAGRENRQAAGGEMVHTSTSDAWRLNAVSCEATWAMNKIPWLIDWYRGFNPTWFTGDYDNP